jgi:hypothetical protein
MLRSDSTIIRVNHKIVGRVVGNTFKKTVKASKHMLREPRGWALDSESLVAAERLGAREVEIEDIESGAIYTASFERIRSRGFHFDRGHGSQICLPLQFWSVRRAEQLVLALGGIA